MCPQCSLSPLSGLPSAPDWILLLLDALPFEGLIVSSFSTVELAVEKNKEKFASAGGDLRPVIRRSDRKEQNRSALLSSVAPRSFMSKAANIGGVSFPATLPDIRNCSNKLLITAAESVDLMELSKMFMETLLTGTNSRKSAFEIKYKSAVCKMWPDLGCSVAALINGLPQLCRFLPVVLWLNKVSFNQEL